MNRLIGFGFGLAFAFSAFGQENEVRLPDGIAAGWCGDFTANSVTQSRAYSNYRDGTDGLEKRCWLIAAVQKGYPLAMLELGRLGLTGKPEYGVAKNPTLGLQLIQRSAELGHWSAMDELAYIYRRGVYVKQDLAKAAYWKKQAAIAFDISTTRRSGSSSTGGSGVSAREARDEERRALDNQRRDYEERWEKSRREADQRKAETEAERLRKQQDQ